MKKVAKFCENEIELNYLSSLLLLQVLLVLLVLPLPLKLEPSSQPLCPFCGALLSHPEPCLSPQPEPAVPGPDAFISPVQPAGATKRMSIFCDKTLI